MATTVLSKIPAHAGRGEAPSAAGALQAANASQSLRAATDDEILNLSSHVIPKKRLSAELDAQSANEFTGEAAGPAQDAPRADASADDSRIPDGEPLADELSAALGEHPELRTAWEDAAAYRESFASPEEAREATRLVSDLNRLDALFFSSHPEDHVELAGIVAQLNPAAAASLARALAKLATEPPRRGENNDAGDGDAARIEPRPPITGHESWAANQESQNAPTPAQTEFFHATNAAAVEGVLGAIHAQVDRLLPEGTSQASRNRVIGEIYRELDASLRANLQLNQQVRQAFRSGALDAAHQRAIVSLITGRARQTLPGVAKRVMNEWTSALVSAGEDRRTRQRAAESRVDIGGTGRSGTDGRRTVSPREIDYSRLSDADILNL